jgi:hypothetical protein
MWLRWSAAHNILIRWKNYFCWSCKRNSVGKTKTHTAIYLTDGMQSRYWYRIEEPNHNALEPVIIILKLHVSFLHKNCRALLQQGRSPDRCSEVKRFEGFITETRPNVFIYNKINEPFLPLHYLGFFVNITSLLQKKTCCGILLL